MLLFLQAMTTLGTATVCVLIAALALRDGLGTLQARLLVALCLSAGLGLLQFAPTELALPTATRWAFRLIGVPATGTLWWFSRSLFDDRYRLDRREWLVMLAVSLFPALYALRDLGLWLPWLASVSSLGMVPPLAVIGALVVSIALGARDDLVEPRRRMRRWIITLLVLNLATSLVAEDFADARLEALVHGALALPTAMVLLWWLARLDPARLVFREPAPAVEAPPTPTPASAEGIDPRDHATLQRLEHLMQVDHVFLDSSLTVGTLAQRVGVPEHQLRALINRGLGYRNFSTYIAQARIAHAKAALANPQNARTQIVSIAMDAGFASLATFNRAFRALEGKTPTEFRKQALEHVVGEGAERSRGQ